MRRDILHWAPAVVLAAGVVLTSGGTQLQRALELRAPLAQVVPSTLLDYSARDIVISDAEQQTAGMSAYLMRSYALAGGSMPQQFSLYVGYYQQQTRGRTIHSPKNCLPGAGWEPLASQEVRIATAGGEVPVNRYILQNGDQRALVLYWYQGRGRVAANEYQVKWDLLRDQALRRRSDEALVRVLVPVEGSEEAAYELASRIARTVMPALDTALPT